MPFRVSGKNIDIGQALRARVNARVAEVTAKYFDGGFSGHVTIGKEGFGFVPTASSISIPVLCSKPMRSRRTLTPAPTKPPCVLKSGCAAISTG